MMIDLHNELMHSQDDRLTALISKLSSSHYTPKRRAELITKCLNAAMDRVRRFIRN